MADPIPQLKLERSSLKPGVEVPLKAESVMTERHSLTDLAYPSSRPQLERTGVTLTANVGGKNSHFTITNQHPSFNVVATLVDAKYDLRMVGTAEKDVMKMTFSKEGKVVGAIELANVKPDPIEPVRSEGKSRAVLPAPLGFPKYTPRGIVEE